MVTNLVRPVEAKLLWLKQEKAALKDDVDTDLASLDLMFVAAFVRRSRHPRAMLILV
jgi:hypothetical protein